MDHQTEHRKMKQPKKTRSFKVDVYVKAIKIDKEDKTTPPHPNTILGKIIDLEEKVNCAQVVTKFGKMSAHISTNRLNKCTKTNVHFEYSKEVAPSTASKLAITQ